MEQVAANATAPFNCHQMDGRLCAGWVGCHGPDNLLALRIHGGTEAVWDYESPVPLFASGAEACEHGLRDIDTLGVRAVATIQKVTKVQQAKNPYLLDGSG